MDTVHSGVTGRTGGSNVEALAVSPRQACQLLGIGTTRLYQLIGAHELVSYHEGRARRITMASIRARVARLAGAPDETPHCADAGSRARSPVHRPRKRPANKATA
jgi:excisionase family DNA binding protein